MKSNKIFYLGFVPIIIFLFWSILIEVNTENIMVLLLGISLIIYSKKNYLLGSLISNYGMVLFFASITHNGLSVLAEYFLVTISTYMFIIGVIKQYRYNSRKNQEAGN